MSIYLYKTWDFKESHFIEDYGDKDNEVDKHRFLDMRIFTDLLITRGKILVI